MSQPIRQILIIQTAFIGDAILATALIEKLHAYHPEADIDFLVRKGNDKLLEHHPILREVLVWNKKEKYKSLWQLVRKVRKKRYDVVVNVQRFFNSGLLAAFSRGKLIIGFDKNPLSFLFHQTVNHQFGDDKNFIHEIDRNLALIESISDSTFVKPKLYPADESWAKVPSNERYICMAPTSVWFTKQWPAAKWVELINALDHQITIYLLGGPGDKAACEHIKEQSAHPKVFNKAGELSLLDSAAMMHSAEMNYANDSAPIHMASAMDAPITAIFCSTVPRFGFTPLSTNSKVVETREKLACRPCGLHGYKSCPEGHFRCADIEIASMLSEEKS